MGDSKTPPDFAEIWAAANHARSYELFGDLARAVAVLVTRIKRPQFDLTIARRPTVERAMR